MNESANGSNAVFKSDELKKMYEVRFANNLSYRNAVWKVLTKNYFQQMVPADATVLDLGAGYGEFINNIVCRKKYAFDLNPDTAKKVNGDVEVIDKDCSMPWPLSDESLDVIFTSNFFEHLPDTRALARTLVEAKRCLKSGGRIIAMGPNIKYLPGVYWDFLDHHIALTENSLSEALSQAGLRVESSIDKFLPFTMVDGPKYPTSFVALYLRIPLAWRILGKQFLVIGRKE